MRASLAALLAGALALTSSIPAQEPGRLGVMASNGVRSVLEELRPRAEAVAGVPLALELSTARTLKDRLEAGEAFDVAILTPELIDALIASGTVRAESRVEFARVGVGVGVRPGFPETGLATADDLRRVLLAARSVAYGGSGQSRETNEAALDALGIADAVRPKVRLTGAGEAPRLVASGDVDVVLTLVSELVNEPGLRYLGPLPGELQAYIYFAAGMSARAREPAAARAVLEFLGSAELASRLGAHGLEAAGR